MGTADSGMTGARSFPNGGGEVGRLIRAFDWSATPLGPLDRWPQSLKTVTEMLLMSPVPIVLLWGEDGVMIYNDAYSGFAGGRHPELLGSKVREGWEEISDFNDNVMRVGLAGQTLAYRDQELTLQRHGRPEPVWMDLDYSPVLDESGKPAGVIAIVVETTQRILAERRVRESEVRFRALVSATADIIYRMSPDWKEMRQLDGQSFLTDVAEPSIAWMNGFLVPEDQAAVQIAIDRAIAAKEPFQLEHRVRKADGEIGWVLSRAVPMLNEAGDIFEWFGAASDVTERHRANDHLQLVINELNHRVKNNLAMVQGIARRTFGDGDIKAAQERFAARLVALAQANDLLTGERWAGASLRGAIEQAVHPHEPDAGRWRIDGPDVRVSPKTALALSLAMHELSTNAVKYGAWSNDIGRVDIIWSIDGGIDGGIEDRRLRIEWREQGGPPVTAPRERGFGSRLIERGLAGEMGGTVVLHFDPAGLRCTIDAPMTIAVES